LSEKPVQEEELVICMAIEPSTDITLFKDTTLVVWGPYKTSLQKPAALLWNFETQTKTSQVLLTSRNQKHLKKP